ncbi:MAG: metal ABC transporter substrate-binding protein [Eubacteriales bacterium]
MTKGKRIVLLLLCAVLGLTLFSCAASTAEDDGRLTVVATNFALYDFARAVCGDTCDVRMLLSPGTESHDFEATLEDVALLSRTDVFVYVGGESEEWVPAVLDAAGAVDVTQVRAMDFVETYPVGETLEEEEHGHDHDAEELDEHVWTSIPNAIVLMRAIREAVLSLDAGLADSLQTNEDAYAVRLMDLHEELQQIVAGAKRNLVVFADRFPFRYFTEEYGLDYRAAFSGCSSSVEPSLATVNSLVEQVNEYALPAVLVIEFSDRKTADAVARETGCDVLEFHSAHNVSRADFDAGITYADLMQRNAEVLKLALN